MSSPDNRTPNWNFILYPESAPENWRELIEETRIEWIESPLHDKDVNPTGEIKKAHYHITLLYPGKKSFEQVEQLTLSLNQPIPVKCQSVKGSIRYMVHKDNPDKYQYDWNKIISHGGADLSSLCSATVSERMQYEKEIFRFIRDNDIIEFSDLIDSIEIMGNDDWHRVAVSFSTMAINAYLRSRRHKAEKELYVPFRKMDKEEKL